MNTARVASLATALMPMLSMPSLFRGFFRLILLLMVHGLPVFSQENQNASVNPTLNFEKLGLYEVEDSVEISDLWSLKNSGPLPYGSKLSLLFETSDEGLKGYVLRDGTEAFTLTDANLDTWSGWSQSHEAKKWGTDQGEGNQVAKVPTLWQHLVTASPNWMDFLLWPTGLRFEVATSFIALPKSKPTAERRLSFTWAQAYFRYVSTEVGIHRSQFGGGVTRYLRRGDINFFTGEELPVPYWDDADWWLHYSIGGPFIRYELRSQAGIVPPYLVFDRNAPTNANRLTSGTIVNWFEQDPGNGLALDEPKSHSGNFSHALNMRIGFLRYSLIWDADAYQFPITHLSLEEIPFGFGTMHFGIWSAANVFLTEIGMDLMPDPLVIEHPTSWPTSLTVMPVRLDFRFRDLKQFQFTMSTQFQIDNRIFRQPGGRQ
jgi:hypothetical protein